VGKGMTVASWWEVLAAELEREKERDKLVHERWTQARRDHTAWSIGQARSYEWGTVLPGEKHRLQTRSKILMLRMQRALDQAERKRLECVQERVLQRLRIGYAIECANRNTRRGQVMRRLAVEAERQRRRIVMPLLRSVARARSLSMSTHLVLSWRTQTLKERVRRDGNHEIRDGERLRVLASVCNKALMSRLLSKSVTQLKLGAVTGTAARSALMARAVNSSAGALVRRVWLQLVGEFAHAIEHNRQQAGWIVECEKKGMSKGSELSKKKASISTRTIYDWRCESCVGGYWNVAGSPTCAKCTYETHVLCEQKDRWTSDDAGKLGKIKELKGRWVTARAANIMAGAEKVLVQEGHEREEQRVRAEVRRALSEDSVTRQSREKNPMHAWEYMQIRGKWGRVVKCAKTSACLWAQALQSVQQGVLEDKVAACRATIERAKLMAAVESDDMVAMQKLTETAASDMAKAKATKAEAAKAEANKAILTEATTTRAAAARATGTAMDRVAEYKAAKDRTEAATTMAASERAAADKAAAVRASACKAAERRTSNKAEAAASRAAAERAAYTAIEINRLILSAIAEQAFLAHEAARDMT
jgi:hypothetical protein